MNLLYVFNIHTKWGHRRREIKRFRNISRKLCFAQNTSYSRVKPPTLIKHLYTSISHRLYIVFINNYYNNGFVVNLYF